MNTIRINFFSIIYLVKTNFTGGKGEETRGSKHKWVTLESCPSDLNSFPGKHNENQNNLLRNWSLEANVRSCAVWGTIRDFFSSSLPCCKSPFPIRRGFFFHVPLSTTVSYKESKNSPKHMNMCGNISVIPYPQVFPHWSCMRSDKQRFCPTTFCLSPFLCDLGWVTFSHVTFCLSGILSCGILSCDILSEWHFVRWHFVWVTFCPVTLCPVTFCLSHILSSDILSEWHFVLWHFVWVAFSPVAFCLGGILSCGILSEWRFVLWHYSLGNRGGPPAPPP